MNDTVSTIIAAVLGGITGGLTYTFLVRPHILRLFRRPDEELYWSCDEPLCVFKIRMEAKGLDASKIRTTFDNIVRTHIYQHAITDKDDMF